MKKKTGKTAGTGGYVKMDDEEQSRRFLETAESLKCRGGKGFKTAMNAIGPKKPVSKPSE